MKTKSCLASILLTTIAVGLCGLLRSVASDPPGLAASATVQEDFGSDFFNGRTNKIKRISTVTPTHVRVIYENGGERNIPRLELNSPLKERYPYDSKAAAEFLRQQSQDTQARLTARKQAWEVQIQALQRQINTLDKEWEEKRRDLGAVRAERKIAPNSKLLKRREFILIEEGKDLGKRRAEMREKLRGMRAQADALQ